MRHFLMITLLVGSFSEGHAKEAYQCPTSLEDLKEKWKDRHGLLHISIKSNGLKFTGETNLSFDEAKKSKLYLIGWFGNIQKMTCAYGDDKNHVDLSTMLDEQHCQINDGRQHYVPCPGNICPSLNCKSG